MKTKVKLIVNISNPSTHTIILEGDSFIVQSVLLIYTKELLKSGTNYQLSFLSEDPEE